MFRLLNPVSNNPVHLVMKMMGEDGNYYVKIILMLLVYFLLQLYNIYKKYSVALYYNFKGTPLDFKWCLDVSVQSFAVVFLK